METLPLRVGSMFKKVFAGNLMKCPDLDKTSTLKPPAHGVGVENLVSSTKPFFPKFAQDMHICIGKLFLMISYPQLDGWGSMYGFSVQTWIFHAIPRKIKFCTWPLYLPPMGWGGTWLFLHIRTFHLIWRKRPFFVVMGESPKLSLARIWIGGLRYKNIARNWFSMRVDWDGVSASKNVSLRNK